MLGKLGIRLVILLGIVGLCGPSRSLGDSIVNPVESVSKLISVPDGDYLVRLEVEGQKERLKFSVQSNRARCTDSSVPKLRTLQGDFENGTNGVLLLSLRGRDFARTQIWILRGDGSAAIREVPDRGEQQSAEKIVGDVSELAPGERAMLGEKMREKAQTGRFASEAETRRSIYVPFLTGLGLPEDAITTVLRHLDGLLRSAVAAGDPMLELMSARASYLDEMKQLMGETTFAKYEAFEQSKPYRRELGLIQEFATTRQATVPLQFQDRLVALLQEFSLYTTETWDGPLDPAPRPAAGSKQVLAYTDAYVNRIRAGLTGFQTQAAVEFPGDLAKLVGEYFSVKLEELAELRRRCLLSPEELKELSRREEEELMRRIKGDAKKVIPPL
jgi:hypothetical protein